MPIYATGDAKNERRYALSRRKLRHDDDDGPLVGGRNVGRVRRLLHVDESCRLGVALLVQEPLSVVDDDRVPAQHCRGLHHRDSVVTGPADQQPERGLKHLDERPHVTG